MTQSIFESYYFIFYIRDLPAIAGALLSTVTVFFKVLPALMDCSSKFLLSPTGGPEAAACGGGGGGGTDILIIFLQSGQQRCDTLTMERHRTDYEFLPQMENVKCSSTTKTFLYRIYFFFFFNSTDIIFTIYDFGSFHRDVSFARGRVGREESPVFEAQMRKYPEEIMK